MLRRRTSPHKGANAAPGRSQLLSQAFQASNSASSSNPGNSAQCTGTQRLLPCSRGAGKGSVSPGRLVACVGAPIGEEDAAGEGDGGMGGLAQDASSAATAIIEPQRQGRIEAVERTEPVLALQGHVMTLLLLEALGALLL